MGLRGPKARNEQDWYKPVAELMVNELMSFSAACQAYGRKFTTATEEHEHEYSPAFRNLLAGMHLDFFVELGSNPTIGREYVLGVATHAIRKLNETGQYDKVTAPLKEISDVLGLTRDPEEKPVLFNLTQADIDKARLELKEREAAQKTEVVSVVVVDGSGTPN